jgi:hypothetical protein
MDYNTATSRRPGNCQTGTNAERNAAPTSAKTTRKRSPIFKLGSGDDDPFGRLSALPDARAEAPAQMQFEVAKTAAIDQSNREAARSR